MYRNARTIRVLNQGFVQLAILAVAGVLFPGEATAQIGPLHLVAEPAAVEVLVGQSVPLSVQVLDASGQPVNVAVRIAAPRGALRVRDGRVQGLEAGTYEVVATTAPGPDASVSVDPLSISVTVAWPAITRLDLHSSSNRIFVGTMVTHSADAYHEDNSRRPGAVIAWSSSDDNVASVDRWGTMTAHAEGSVTLTAAFEAGSATRSYSVETFPADRLTIDGGAETARTGDVLHFEATGTAGGQAIEELPVTWAYTFVPDDSIRAPGASAIVEDGAFVAEVPGRYTVLAMSGPLVARSTVLVHGREAVQDIELQGRGAVTDSHTSDLWVFEGVDGRDYAVTGTWAANGWAFFWDVTDPTNISKVDSIQVDARTVNDVKVSPDGRYAALSREGASNRRNGVVILDMADPANPVIASTFDSNGVTGGVHNMFATNDYLFALAAGDKYVIIDVRDPYDPKFVSEYNHPDSRIHDVWVHDGIAYSSEWQTGVVVVDVGNGRWGGSIQNPVFVTAVPYPVGATHAAFPYAQESTGKFYLFLGDEISGGRGAAWAGQGADNQRYDPASGEGGVQGRMSGYLHIIDFTDPENPRDIARYEVPEAGAHNLWVEEDVLYQAYYKGGLRVVDVSGELMGDLMAQGREIAIYKPQDPGGFLPNQVSVWGGQPHKGYVFFSDMNSGLWAAKVMPKGRPVS
ncbi:MAG: Ig-like domain-containing protein [Gemmatimonadota bacterium]|nr:Ig-like domain-containing protein [Gemmatimonadota bacterium]MDE3005495.1 Ig-like domain-containing protein [Gemmatimonadota bacterium]